MYLSVREHYRRGQDHCAQDLALMEKIMVEKNPDYRWAMEKYLSDSVCYFGNIYIMRRELFEDYCAWLFPLLKEFDSRAKFDGRNSQQMRADGYLAERLFGIYLTKHQAEWTLLELPRVHFEENRSVRWKQKLINTLLPPGSKRRYNIKKMKLYKNDLSEEII